MTYNIIINSHILVHKEKEEIMETKIQAIHFDASESLVSFIQKKSKNLYVKT